LQALAPESRECWLVIRLTGDGSCERIEEEKKAREEV